MCDIVQIVERDTSNAEIAACRIWKKYSILSCILQKGLLKGLRSRLCNSESVCCELCTPRVTFSSAIFCSILLGRRLSAWVPRRIQSGSSSMGIDYQMAYLRQKDQGNVALLCRSGLRNPVLVDNRSRLVQCHGCHRTYRNGHPLTEIPISRISSCSIRVDHLQNLPCKSLP